MLDVLLRQEVAGGVELLSAQGPVGPREAEALVAAVERALALEPRGVVLDLREVSSLTREAQQGLCALQRVAGPWPRPALVVCSSGALPELDRLPVVASRDEALAHVDDRAGRPRVRVDLEDGPRAAAQARAAVLACAARLGVEDVADELVLVVSEMVTNAVRHAAPPVRLEVEAGERDVVVAVQDGTPSRPTRRAADVDAEGGRGLMLVDLLALESGVRPDPPGKVVWARLPRLSGTPLRAAR